MNSKHWSDLVVPLLYLHLLIEEVVVRRAGEGGGDSIPSVPNVMHIFGEWDVDDRGLRIEVKLGMEICGRGRRSGSMLYVEDLVGRGARKAYDVTRGSGGGN